MDLSTNKINFKGIKGAYRADNTPVFEFIIPPHKKGEKITLGIAPLRKDEQGNYIEPSKEDIRYCNFGDKNILRVLQRKLEDLSSGFSYFYVAKKDNGEDAGIYLDPFRTIDMRDANAKMNIIEQGYKYGITPKCGNMYHAFIDSNAILDKDGNLLDKVPGFVRNHYNKLGGSLKGLIYILQNTNLLDSYTYLMTNPDIGMDRISSSCYWPENLYRCHDINNFKEINLELYKQGKGYVADGAFTSQGISSAMVQHALKWGEETPLYYMLKTDGSGSINPGVLPDNDPYNRFNPYEHIGIRLVNPKGKGYDDSKPTYIQFFDDRLLSPEAQKDSTRLIFDTDIKPEDHYEIISDNDSAKPYYFEVDPDDENIKKAFENGKTTKMLTDFSAKDSKITLDEFLTFKNFKIVKKSETSGVTSWDGNVDLIKLNTSNPGSDPKYKEGCENARNYVKGVATFWTETIQRELILKTALMDDNEKRLVAFKNQVSPKRYAEMINAIKEGKIILPVLEQAKTVENYIKEFPLQSLETNSDVSAVFIEPQFAQEFLKESTLKKIMSIVNSVIDSSIPDEYRGNDEYKTYAVKLYANDILKNIYAGALRKDAINDDGSININKLNEVNLKTVLEREPFSVKDERELLCKALKNGINPNSTFSLQKRISKELSHISLDDFKLAETIVLQGKAGLNWRYDAAKDIGDLDAVRDGKATHDQIWNGDAQNPGAFDLWCDFNKNVRKYHPGSYIINEMTMLDSFCSWDDVEAMYDFDPKSAALFDKKYKDSVHKNDYKYHPPYVLEINSTAESNSTTNSIFDNYFNNLSCLAGSHPECGTNTSEQAGNLKRLKKQVDEFIMHTYPSNAMLAHFFTENHDKPRLLHTLPLDMNLFLCENLENSNEVYKKLAQELTGGRVDYRNISPKAIAVAAMMRVNISKVCDFIHHPEYKEPLFEALQNLTNGKRVKNQPNDFRRADAFGCMPYEISLEDIVEDAGLKGKINPIDIHWSILNSSMNTQESLVQVSNCLVGTPTIYNGLEYGQTGYETKNKNVYVCNRNQVLHNIVNESGYHEYYTRIDATQATASKNGMRALRSGTPMSLEVDSCIDEDVKKLNEINYMHYNNAQDSIAKISNYIANTHEWTRGGAGMIEPRSIFEFLDIEKEKGDFAKTLNETFGISNSNDFIDDYDNIKSYFLKADNSEISFYPIYRYDETGSQVISIATNNGLPRSKEIANDGNNSKAITLEGEKNVYNVTSIKIKNSKGECPLEDNTILKRKIYDEAKGTYIDDDIEYKVLDGEIQTSNGDKIYIDDTALYFYVPKKNNAAKYSTAYHGAH